MAFSKPGDPMAAIPEHSNATKLQENNLKNNFMEIIQALKQEVKNPLKEIEERQKMEEINKFFKESHNNKQINEQK